MFATIVAASILVHIFGVANLTRATVLLLVIALVVAMAIGAVSNISVAFLAYRLLRNDPRAVRAERQPDRSPSVQDPPENRPGGSGRRVAGGRAQWDIIAATGEVPMHRSSPSAFLLGRRGRRITGRRWGVGVPALAVAAMFLSAVPATALAAGSVGAAVLHVGQAARQDVPSLPGSEPDTLVEPDVAVSPLNPDIAVAVAHDGRYPDGGAVGIETAWTDNGGASWHHRPLPGVTATTGGSATWERASDPIVVFAADGSAYVSTLVFNAGCDSGVVVSRSTDGGKTFGQPVFAHRSATCDVSDDKNTLVVDTSSRSPHRGRLYQFWTPFLTDIFGNFDGSPQALVFSDDHGRTWSKPINVTLPHANTQNSQPMLLPNGALVDAYIDFGPNAAAEGPEAAAARAGHRQAAVAPSAAAAAAAQFVPVFTTAVSTDGGATWSPGGDITRDLGDGPAGFRCCLMSATADPVNGRLYAAWNAVDTTKVRMSSSTTGKKWSTPVTVNRPSAALLGVNVDVSAYRGTVAVSYGVTNSDIKNGRFGRQLLSLSRDSGAHFLDPVVLGPRTDYAYAAFARGIFPGDYIGSAMTRDRLYTVWMVAGKPPVIGAKYHQVMWAAVLDTSPGPLQNAVAPANVLNSLLSP